jgi:hypothetical protein
MLRNKTIFVAVAFATLFPACSSKKGTTDPGLDAMFGTYGLISINALAVPVTVSLTSTKKVEIMSSTLNLNSSGAFTNATTYRTSENGVVTTKTETCGGNFLVHQSTISFSENVVTNTTCGSRYPGLWNGVNTIAIDFDPTTHAVFTK